MAEKNLTNIVLLFILVKSCAAAAHNNNIKCKSPPQDIFKLLCTRTNDSTPLVEMSSENLYVNDTDTIIYIHCYSEDPLILTNNLLPKKSITKRPIISFDSCRFPANETITKILNESLTIYKTKKLIFKNEDIDNSLTRANLKGLGEINELSFCFKNLLTLPKDLFSDLTDLKKLQISSKNSQLPAIFDSLENLESLNLTENNLQDISVGIFAHQSNLKELVLFRNNLTNLEANAFEGLVSLRSLDLGWNNIQTLKPAVFSHLSNLSEISLDGNSFGSLPNDLFAENKKLAIFSLTKNRGALKQLPKGLLRDLPFLNNVTINCQLESIPSDLFANSAAIKEIHIFGNLLHDVMPLGLFENQYALNELELSGNQIKQLVSGLFNNTTNLTALNLSNNSIRFLSDEIFNSLSNLQVLNLENNQLATAGNELFKSLIHMNLIDINLRNNKITSIKCSLIENSTSIINLAKNPLHCDCQISCLIQQIEKSLDPWNDTILCESPSILQGRKLIQLKPTELICPLDRQNHNYLSPCSNKCSYGLRSYDAVLIINCSDGNLTTIPAPPTFDQTISNGTELFIEHNSLIEFSSNTLREHTNIILFSVIQNNTVAYTTLPEGYLSNFRKLQTVHLDLRLEDLPEKLFVNSTAIVNLTISGTNLRKLEKNLFEDQTSLLYLDLSRNKLESLTENGFSSNHRLEILRLSHNLLTNLEESMFYNLSNLKSIYLDNNKIKIVNKLAFNHANSLTFINMENNNIVSIEPFSRLYSTLKTLILRNNSIEKIFYEHMRFSPLTYLDLSSNNISIIDLSYLANMKNPIKFNLRKNHIRTIKLENSEFIFESVSEAEFGENPLNCDCNIVSFVRLLKMQANQNQRQFNIQKILNDSIKDLQCSSPDNLKDRFVSTLSLEELVCPVNSGCPKECQCWNRTFDSVLIVNCSNANLASVPSLSYLETALSNRTDLLIEHNPRSGYKSMNNKITLDLSFNRLERLDDETIKSWTENRNLRSVYLRNNRWICDCSSEKLYQLIMLKQNLFPDLEKMQCVDGQVLKSLIYSDICSNYTLTVLGIAIGIIGIFLGLIAFLYYKNKEYILVWMYSHGICLRWITEEELDRNKRYDAFVSYSSQDIDFVVDELIPTLQDGPIPYKLCLHDRDWIVGGYIPDQIVNSVENSKRTIVVMSKNYIKSQWARLEFRTAHNASLNEKRALVIVILLDDIEEIENLDSDLQQYLRMYMYMRWGDPLFWDKINYAMPHPLRKSQRINDAHASLIENNECIELNK